MIRKADSPAHSFISLCITNHGVASIGLVAFIIIELGPALGAFIRAHLWNFGHDMGLQD